MSEIFFQYRKRSRFIPVMHFRKVELQGSRFNDSGNLSIKHDRGLHFKISVKVKNEYGTDPFYDH